MKKAFGSAVGLALALLLATACGPAAPTDGKRVVLVTIDTLRADHLGLYGYPRPTSEFLDALAARSVVFDRAFTTMSHTVPAHASLFSSLYPSQHGARKNGHQFDESHLTLAEWLQAQGFLTAAFPSVAFITRSGLDQGFDHIDVPELNPETKRYNRDAAATVSRVIEWLDSAPRHEHLFLWIHFWDPHAPPDPPPGPLREIHRLRDARQIAGFLAREQHIKPSDYDSEAHLLWRINRYDAEIRHVDQQLRRLYAHMDSDPRETFWIVTADHGEGLGTHRGYKSHDRQLYNEMVRVPLIIHSNRLTFAPGRVGQVTDNTDIFPTIVDLLGATGPDIPASQGCSLYAFLVDGAQRYCTRDQAFAERRVFDEPEVEAEKGLMYALQSDREKLILTTPGREERYDLSSDPYEQHDLADETWPETALQLKRQLGQQLDRMRASAAEQHEMVDEQLIEELRALGYVQ